ncbi:MAG: homoserine kinase [Flavobacteriaceae bacterium]|nr:MAG: homoserine kinase [Flavobacteriaceae bacterium]
MKKDIQNKVHVFCPASLANVSCGFDVLGIALDTPGDHMWVERIPEPKVEMVHLDGYNLPLIPEENVAGKAALEIIKDLKLNFGFKITIDKKIHPGSGVGSSSASASGVVYGINCLLEEKLTEAQMLHYAMVGEYVASASYHADNIGPALLGGIFLVRGYDPLDYIKIPTPEELWVCIITPKIEIRTQDARKVLKNKVSLKQAITQWGNLAGLIAGFYTSNYELIGRSLEDVIVEPQRSPLIPLFSNLQEMGKKAGALGVGISGSGPSVFGLCKGEETAQKVCEAFQEVYQKANLPFEIYKSKVNEKGVKLLD